MIDEILNFFGVNATHIHNDACNMEYNIEQVSELLCRGENFSEDYIKPVEFGFECVFYGLILLVTMAGIYRVRRFLSKHKVAQQEQHLIIHASNSVKEIGTAAVSDKMENNKPATNNDVVVQKNAINRQKSQQRSMSNFEDFNATCQVIVNDSYKGEIKSKPRIGKRTHARNLDRNQSEETLKASTSEIRITRQQPHQQQQQKENKTENIEDPRELKTFYKRSTSERISGPKRRGLPTSDSSLIR